MSYRVYVTTSLQHMARNEYITTPWYDIVRPTKRHEADGAEIAADVIRRAGLVVR